MVSEQNKTIVKAIVRDIQDRGINYNDLMDLLDMCKITFPEDDKWTLSISSYIKKLCLHNISQGINSVDMDTIYWKTVKEESFYDFESFMEYMERNRPFEKKFYAPRKQTLTVVAHDLMDLENREIDFLGVSLPSRTGKSTICIFFLAWIMLKRPNSHSAMGGHSGILVKGFYKELLNLILTNEYTFAELYAHFHQGEIFVQGKSAEDFTITLGNPDRFATVTCRGIDGTWIGAVDVSSDGYLYVDDLVRDRQHSLSPKRMEDTYQEYLNKMTDRKNDGARELMVGTLWNVFDPLERLRKQYEGNPRYRFRKIPALDENDESNFDYEVNGFSTEWFHKVRERLDKAEWEAKYMQRPFVREGLLFPSDNLRSFDSIEVNSLTNRKVVAVCDPALGGGDYLSMPICMCSDEKEKYIIDWIYTQETTKFSIPKIINAIKMHFITELYVENDGVGMVVFSEIKKEIENSGISFCKIEPKHAPNRISKEDKIVGCSDYILDNFYFNSNCNGDYRKALDDLCMYTTQGKNEHDDAADSLAQLSLVFKPLTGNGEIEIPDWFQKFVGGVM